MTQLEVEKAELEKQLEAVDFEAGRVEEETLSVRTIYRLIDNKELPPPVKVGGSSRWCESDVVEYMNKVKQTRYADWRSRQASKSAKTKNDFLAAIRGLIRWLCRNGSMVADPLTGVPRINLKGKRVRNK